VSFKLEDLNNNTNITEEGEINETEHIPLSPKAVQTF